MKNQYKYLISYSCDVGGGSLHITSEVVLNSFEKIDRLKTKAQREFRVNNMIINNYLLVSKKTYNRKFIK